jgi:hypothetical protein
MNPLNATFARLHLGLFAALMLAAPAISYGQEDSRDEDRRSRWGRSEDGDRERGRDRGRGRDRDRRRDDDDEDEKPAYVAPARSLSPANESMGFGKPKATLEGRPFGVSQSSASGSGSNAADRDRQWADRAMKKYDTSRDGHISGDELDKTKIEKYDKNSDGKVDFDELVDFSRGQPKSPTGAPLSFKSYRLLTASEKLPKEGLPSWFNDRDRDHDGQVSMHEWSRSWNSSTVRDFTSKDADGDGIITVAEAIAIEPAR